LLEALALFFIAAPVGVVVGLNWEKYAPREVTSSGWSLSFGLIFSFIIVLLVYTKKVQAKNPLSVLIVITALLWLLDPIITDAKIITAAATGGAIIDYLFLNPAIEELKETIKMTKQAKIQAKAMAEVDRGR